MSGDKGKHVGADAGGDVGPDVGGDVWLTYGELADRLGISVPSAQRRVTRSRWRRRPGNDGRARIAVPRHVLPDVRPDVFPGAGEDVTPDTPGHLFLPTPTAGRMEADALGHLLAKLEPLEAALEAERLGRAADRQAAAAARAEQAELHGRELAAIHERVGRAEAERDAAIREAAASVARVQDELRGWSEGNFLTRAARAMFWRRG